MTPLVSFAAFYCVDSECARARGVCVYVDAPGKSRCYKGLVSLESESGTCVFVCICIGMCVCVSGKDLRPVNLFHVVNSFQWPQTIQKVADSYSRSKWVKLERSGSCHFRFNWKFVSSWDLLLFLALLLLLLIIITNSGLCFWLSLNITVCPGHISPLCVWRASAALCQNSPPIGKL